MQQLTEAGADAGILAALEAEPGVAPYRRPWDVIRCMRPAGPANGRSVRPAGVLSCDGRAIGTTINRGQGMLNRAS